MFSLQIVPSRFQSHHTKISQQTKMTVGSKRFNWGKESFFECYCQLRDDGFVSSELLELIKPDLLALATIPARVSSSTPIPEEVEFPDGKYKLNTSFRETATILLLELNVDPLVAADLCHLASVDAFRRGTDLLDSARALFFHRIDLILQIVGFLVSTGQIKLLTSTETEAITLLTPILSSFDTVHTRLLAQNDIINKQRASSDINSLAFAGAINFTKSEYLHQHESLGKLLYSLIQQYPQQFATVEVFNKIINVTNNIPDNDILTIHFLPSLMEIIFSSLGIAVEQLYRRLTEKLRNDYQKIFESDELNMEKSTLRPLEVFLILVFLTKFIQWCQEDDKLTEKYSFTDDILKYIEWCISYGAFEKFLCISADTTKATSKKEDLYDFRLLLERSLPRLLPILLSYQRNSHQNSIPNSSRQDVTHNGNPGFTEDNLPSIFKDNFSLSPTFNDDLIAPLLHSFVQQFITFAAVVLTLLRDSEEDFLLSLKKEIDSDVDETQLDLDELASRADLERLYSAASYVYYDRTEIVMELWESGDMNGFIQWASSNNTLPLITASFSILLGSLANESTGLRIWDLLINMSTMKKNDYLKLLADSIVESLQYYIDALNSNFQEDPNNQRPDFLRLEQNKAKTPLMVELTEDSLVFISGFIQLIGGITNSIDPHIHLELKSRIWNRFKPIIESFLILDNKAVTAAESVRVLDDNRATLVCLMLYFLGCFVDDNLVTRHEIWEILDKWLYHGFENKRGLSGKPVQVFLTSITRLTQVEFFVSLMGKLFKPLDTNLAFEPYRLLYPANLGALYRAEGTGVWPYVEFLLFEILSKSYSLEDTEKREKIQNDILQITNTALKNVDWVFLCQTVQETIRSEINLDTLIEGKDITFPKFVKLHHSLAFLSFLFESKVYNTLFQAFENTSNVDFKNYLGLHAPLETIQLILKLQPLFNEKLIRMLRNDEFDIPRGAGQGTSMSFVLLQQQSQGPLIYYKAGLHPIDFFEVLVFNLPVVATFGILVGSQDSKVASTSCSLLKSISHLQYFVGNQLIQSTLENDRLLTTFREIDDSNRIIFAFIQQIESSIDDDIKLGVKKQVLDFILENVGTNVPTVAHFLLGYEFKGDHLILTRSGNTLMKTLVYILSESLDQISYVDFNNSNVTVVDGPPASISSKILEVLVKLCQSSITSQVTLEFLRNYEIQDVTLFHRLLKLPRIDRFTEWSGVKFSKELSSEFLRLEGPKTLISFINQRDQLLKYFALELHNIPSALVQRQLYVNTLLKNSDFLDGTPNVLQFLDVGILNFDPLELKLSKYSSKYNLELILEEIGKDYDLTILEKIFKLLCTSQHDASKERQTLIAETVMDEGVKFTDIMLKCAIYRDFRAMKLANIHSWVQLIQVILTDTDIGDSKKSEFVLEVFQIVLPKINDYLARDVKFAEELISLCVLLFDVYQKSSNLESALANLIPLFLTCTSGVVGLQAAPDLRLDLYVLLCRYLQKLIAETELRKQLVGYLKSAGSKFIDTICNDAVYAEGAPRITALVLLEQLIHLSSTQKNNFVFELMIKNNLLMLLARLLKRTDEIVSLCSSENEAGSSGMSASSILYELTAFKLTIYLLVRLASTRSGALQLVQNEIFPVILDCKFLQVDPDVGLYLHFQESKEHDARVKLSLDVPLVFDQNETGSEGLSYYEFLVPVFQLITLVLISMGPSYQPGVDHGKQVLKHFKSIIVGILKRDSLLENNELPASKYGPGTSERLGLEELTKLITLLDSLVHPSK